MGNLPKNNSWSNIAIRWEKLKFTNQTSYDVAMKEFNNDISRLGGLQLLLNLEMIGHSLLPEEQDCTMKDELIYCKKTTIAQEPITPTTMMLGCHKTDSNPDLRAGGAFDEVAFWSKRIPDEKRHMFLGGWSRLLNFYFRLLSVFLRGKF